MLLPFSPLLRGSPYPVNVVPTGMTSSGLIATSETTGHSYKRTQVISRDMFAQEIVDEKMRNII